MGEWSDYYLDRMFDRMLESDFDCPRSVVCKHCGARDLTWKETPAGWRLYDNPRATKPHDCNPPSADDFEALP